jgi:hypothetical protein
MKGGWRKLGNEATHNLHSRPNIAGMVKSRKLRLTRHVALMGEHGNGNKTWNRRS